MIPSVRKVCTRAFGATMTAAQVAAVEPDHGRRSHGVDFWICASRWTQSRDTLADASGSIAHSAGVYCAANGQQLSKQLGDFRKRRKRGELGGHIGEFGRHASFKRQRRKAAQFLRDVTTLAMVKPPHPKRHMAEQRPKGHLPVSLARKHRPAIRAAMKSLPHRRRLRADHLRLDSHGKLFSLNQCQTECFGNGPIFSFDPSHFDLRRRSSAEIGHKFDPPHQLLHSSASPVKNQSLAFKTEGPTTLHVLHYTGTDKDVQDARVGKPRSHPDFPLAIASLIALLKLDTGH